jgi:hypothetical protein
MDDGARPAAPLAAPLALSHGARVPPRPPPRRRAPQPNRVFQAPPFFVFHYGNCYETTGPGGGRQLVRAPPCLASLACVSRARAPHA